jgi:hypothetical protein
MSLTDFIQRARAPTKWLLGSDYQVTTDKGPMPPVDASKYSDARLKEGLAFADYKLCDKTRKVSPVASHCLTIYKSTLRALLEKEYVDEDERTSLLSNVIMFEEEIYTNQFLRGPGAEINTDLVDRLAELRHYEFAVRYGDYLADVYQKLNPTAKVERTQDFDQLPDRYWTNINNEIKGEREAWVQWNLHISTPDKDVKTTLAIFHVCCYIGLNLDRMVQTIAMYAEQNTFTHGSILDIVERGEWHALAETLAQDLRDLPVITPSHLRENIPIIQETIEAIVDEYFQRNKELSHDFNWWSPKETNIEKAAKLKDGKIKNQDAAVAERKRVHEQAEKRCRKLINDFTMVYLTTAAVDVKKRTVKYMRQELAWYKLVALQKELSNNLVKYRDAFSITASSIDSAFWLDISDKIN